MDDAHFTNATFTDSFRQWYGRNAETYNETRKERYANDPDFREAAIKQAARYREKAKAEGIVPEPRNGLYSSAAVAAFLGVSTQTLRNWEARGVIPKATFGKKQRQYTRTQMHLIRAVVQASTATVEEEKARMWAHWGSGNAGNQ
jgi:DNA-binding transcriptional regulator YiaG